MKHLFIAVTLMASVMAKNSMATEVTVSPAIVQAFQQAFENATQVVWSEVDPLYKASFYFKGQKFAAFFDHDGDLVATTRILTTSQLPVTLQASLERHYPNAVTGDCFEVDKDGAVYYYVTFEDQKTRTLLKASPSDDWYTYKKTNKK